MKINGIPQSGTSTPYVNAGTNLRYLFSKGSSFMNGKLSVFSSGRSITTNIADIFQKNFCSQYLVSTDETLFSEDFSADSGKFIAPYYGEATATIADGEMEVLAANFDKSVVSYSKSFSKNSIISVKLVSAAGSPQVHLREQNDDNFLMVYVSSSTGKFRIAKMVAGTLTTVEEVAITGFSTANEYTLTVKCFETHVVAELYDDAGILLHSINEYGANIVHTGVVNGLGCGSATAATYDDFYFRNVLDEYTNAVCLGDSNTGGSTNPAANPGIGLLFPGVIATASKTQKRTLVNKGVSGDQTTNISARITDLTGRKVAGATNIAIVAVGTNDIALGEKTAEETFADLETLWGQVVADGWELWACTVPVKQGDTAHNDEVRALNALILASATPDKVIDIHEITTSESNENQGKTGYFYADNIHFTATGHAAIASEILSQF